ncbi:trehalose-phosphatase [Noviherbaspirillum cavernae]|uniref:Trehalose 6-phosphate phosphatase n=1 Tax=Noviherbaspirillum cavernae TaxID=2320862 RepID=A0A418WX71_9BURK|nr:trehalose-phosphatase [Noviherbaspirillum cavernae]RJG04839.1 trehalose-phosphatase [Noviherbaspirillum cavernae]
MSLPFFECSAARLDELVRPGMLCAFDFDGTLAPIAREPHGVLVPAAVARRLAHLADHAAIAIVTGRAVDDVRPRLDFPASFIVGNHGLEGVPGRDVPADHFAARCAQWERSLPLALRQHGIVDPGIHVENKGCSLSLHYRLAREREALEPRLADICRSLQPSAHVIEGKFVFNLLPVNGINKGEALNRLIEASGARSAIYVGDDTTDEDVFRLRRTDVLSVRIEPDERSAAEFHLHHRLGMIQLLDELTHRMRRFA